MKRILLAACVLLTAPAAAQTGPVSPHGQLALECATCHRAEGWTPVRLAKGFNHGRLGFPLIGAHAAIACRSCHQGLDFRGTPSTCSACHQDVHRGELGADCSRCHSNRSFLDRSAMTRAHQQTRFPLEGAHLAADCTSCHTPAAQGALQFVARPTECDACHERDFAAARSPDHVAGGLPRDCQQCHSATLWGRGRFNHDVTRFALTGAHRAVPCVECHTNNRYAGTPTLCVECHQLDYNGTTSPAHAPAGFGTDCATCHATTDWVSGFDHSRTAFPLTGAHRTTPCDKCHGDGVYRGKSQDCATCHRTDYDQATNPNHPAAGFPTDCKACHNTVVWTQAVFDHDSRWFPIYHGHHRGTWSTCADCHQVATDFGQFTCLTCHEHSKSRMDSEHQGRSGYQYVSQECLRCHPSP
jgi:hypothetical protein